MEWKFKSPPHFHCCWTLHVLINFGLFCLCCILGVFQMCMAISFMLDIKSCCFRIKPTEKKMVLAQVNMWVYRFGSNVNSVCKFELGYNGQDSQGLGFENPLVHHSNSCWVYGVLLVFLHLDSMFFLVFHQLLAFCIMVFHVAL